MLADRSINILPAYQALNANQLDTQFIVSQKDVFVDFQHKAYLAQLQYSRSTSTFS